MSEEKKSNGQYFVMTFLGLIVAIYAVNYLKTQKRTTEVVVAHSEEKMVITIEDQLRAELDLAHKKIEELGLVLLDNQVKLQNQGLSLEKSNAQILSKNQKLNQIKNLIQGDIAISKTE